MSKSPKIKRKKKIIRRTVYKGQSELSGRLIKSHNKLIKLTAEKFDLLAMDTVSQLMEIVFRKVYLESLENSSVFAFCNFYDKTYEKVLENYEKVIGIYDECNDDFEIDLNKDIFNGLVSIYSLRIKEYMENFDNNKLAVQITNSANKSLEGFVNSTKKAIYSKFPFILGEIYTLSVNNRWDMNTENIDNMVKDMEEIILQWFFDDIYSSYCESIENAIKKIDENMERDLIDNYLSYIKEEYEIAGQVIKIQIPPLENTENDSEIVQDILYLVRESYQYLGRKLEDINEMYLNLFKSKEIISSDKETLYKYLLNEIKISRKKEENYASEHSSYLGDFKNNFMFCIERILNVKTKINNNIDLEVLKDECIKEDYLLSQDIIKVFRDDMDYSDKNHDLLKEKTGIEIIKGIRETIDIKIQSLEENLDYYIETINKVDLSLKPISITDMAKNSFDDLFEKWKYEFFDIIDYRHENVNYVNSFFRVKTKNISDNALNLYNRKVFALKENIEKVSLNYKRETLLFEVSTFEEILNYSISKLKENDDEDVLNYCEKIEASYFTILNILKKYKIEQINPEEKSDFNPKLHEVLMANEKEGFPKGKVIKVLNKGYKKNDQVILRANIIASK